MERRGTGGGSPGEGYGSSERAGIGKEMQNASCCHLLMRYNA